MVLPPSSLRRLKEISPAALLKEWMSFSTHFDFSKDIRDMMFEGQRVGNSLFPWQENVMSGADLLVDNNFADRLSYFVFFLMSFVFK